MKSENNKKQFLGEQNQREWVDIYNRVKDITCIRHMYESMM